MKRVIFALAACLVLVGCTITPNDVTQHVMATDISTPPGILQENNGWVGWVHMETTTQGVLTLPDNKTKLAVHVDADAKPPVVAGQDYGLLTSNKKAHYINLINAYRVQYAEEYKEPLDESRAGVTPCTVQVTECWLINLERITTLKRLRRWEDNHKDTDSLWQKLMAR